MIQGNDSGIFNLNFNRIRNGAAFRGPQCPEQPETSLSAEKLRRIEVAAGNADGNPAASVADEGGIECRPGLDEGKPASLPFRIFSPVSRPGPDYIPRGES